MPIKDRIKFWEKTGTMSDIDSNSLSKAETPKKNKKTSPSKIRQKQSPTITAKETITKLPSKKKILKESPPDVDELNETKQKLRGLLKKRSSTKQVETPPPEVCQCLQCVQSRELYVKADNQLMKEILGMLDVHSVQKQSAVHEIYL